jgi:nucleoside-diphosphate-sugar epimerase
VLNNLCGLAWTTREIRMQSDGTPWRPLVHLLDICNAIACVLKAPRERVHEEILNVGDSGANYQIREVAEIVGRVFPGCEVTVGTSGGDNRSYRVSFAKIAELLPEFRCAWDAELGARQLLDVFSRVALTEEDFSSPRYTRLKRIEQLLSTAQLDDSLYWRVGAEVPAAAG